MSLKDSLVRRLGLASAWSWAGFGCLATAVALLVLLKGLPYSSVHLAAIDSPEANRRPTPDFSLGPVSWPVAALAQDPALQPFRDAMHASCDDAKGIDAAACLSAVLAARTPVGEPSTEFVNVSFDSRAHFARHLAGAPGHCLTRSAILATQLLSVGIPARVVQMVPARAKGHTLVEVWDEAMGWTVVDPSTGGFMTGATRHASAVELLADPASVEWKRFGSAATSVAEVEANTSHLRALLSGDLLYPEPWLYLRLGDRVAPWPYRGHYVRVGPSYWMLGPAQQVLAWAIPLLALTGLSCFILAWRKRQPHAVASQKATRTPTEVGATGRLDSLRPS